MNFLHWIKMIDKMPLVEPTLDFLFVTMGERPLIHIGCRPSEEQIMCHCHDGLVDSVITHWMPLPDYPDEVLENARRSADGSHFICMCGATIEVPDGIGSEAKCHGCGAFWKRVDPSVCVGYVRPI